MDLEQKIAAREALRDMNREFASPLARRLMGGHSPGQQLATLAASNALAQKDGGNG